MTSIKKVSAYLKFETLEDRRDGLTLDEFIEKYQIVWVLTERGTPLFVMSDLAAAKGNNPRDYMNALNRFMEGEEEQGENVNLKDYDFSDPHSTAKDIKVCRSQVPGIAYQFKGDTLKEFKRHHCVSC